MEPSTGRRSEGASALPHKVFGLALSTLSTGVVFVATLLIWSDRRHYRLRASESTSALATRGDA